MSGFAVTLNSYRIEGLPALLIIFTIWMLPATMVFAVMSRWWRQL